MTNFFLYGNSAFFFRKFLAAFLLVTLTASLSSCGFTTVDFKYDSDTYLRPQETFATLEGDPEAISLALSLAFRESGFVVLSRQRINRYLKIAEAADDCWDATKVVISQEWTSFDRNDFAGYNNIDRQAPFAAKNLSGECKTIEFVSSNSVDSWELTVELPERQAVEKRNPTADMFSRLGGLLCLQANTPGGDACASIAAADLSRQSKPIGFTTRIRIVAWKFPDDRKTQIRVVARPVNNQVEACPGCAIGYKWRKEASGYYEFKIASTLLAFLRDIESLSQLSAPLPLSDKTDGHGKI